jgi:hypothetical protein
MSPRPARPADLRQRDPVVKIGDATLRVYPGQVAHTTLTVTNVVDQVEGYTVEACQGPARHWCDNAPRHVELLPGQQATVTVTFHPPLNPSPPAGDFPVGLLVVSRVDGARRAVVECDVTVEAIHGLEAQLLAVTGRGSHRGRYRIDLENTGTAPATITLTPQQQGEPSLSFALQPRELAVPAGETAVSYLLVRPVRPTLLGRQQSLPFSIGYAAADPRGEPDHQDPPVPGTGAGTLSGRVDGAFLRRPVIPRGILATVLLLAVLGIAAATAARLLIPHPQPAALRQIAPPPPTLEAVQQTPDGITVTWRPVPTAGSYRIERLATPTSTGASETIDADAAVTNKTLPNPTVGEHCYRIVAVNDTGSSEPSATACVTVIAGPAPTTQAITGAYVLYGKPVPITDADAYPKALQAINGLTGTGLQAKLLDTSKIPIPGVHSSYVAYQDGFQTTTQAQQYCGLVAQQQIECHANDPLG